MAGAGVCVLQPYPSQSQHTQGMVFNAQGRRGPASCGRARRFPVPPILCCSGPVQEREAASPCFTLLHNLRRDFTTTLISKSSKTYGKASASDAFADDAFTLTMSSMFRIHRPGLATDTVHRGCLVRRSGPSRCRRRHGYPCGYANVRDP